MPKTKFDWDVGQVPLDSIKTSVPQFDCRLLNGNKSNGTKN